MDFAFSPVLQPFFYWKCVKNCAFKQVFLHWNVAYSNFICSADIFSLKYHTFSLERSVHLFCNGIITPVLFPFFYACTNMHCCQNAINACIVPVSFSQPFVLIKKKPCHNCAITNEYFSFGFRAVISYMYVTSMKPFQCIAF